jgi:hypothetical protein
MKNKNIYFFRFPPDSPRKRAWVQKIRRENWMPNKNTVLCSKHFQPEDFEASAEHRQRRDLKRTAVPSIFDLPEHLQPKKVKLRKPPIGRVVDAQVEDATEVVPDVHADVAAEVKPSSIPVIDTVSLEHDYCLEDAKVLKTKLDRFCSL